MLNVQSKRAGTITVLELNGKIVVCETEILRDTVNSLPDTRRVILDLAQVSSIDAHGLGVLLELREHLAQRGTAFELKNLSLPVTKVLHMTRLDSVFNTTAANDFIPAVVHGQRTSAHSRWSWA